MEHHSHDTWSSVMSDRCPIHGDTIEYSPDIVQEEDGSEYIEPNPYCTTCLLEERAENLIHHAELQPKVQT